MHHAMDGMGDIEHTEKQLEICYKEYARLGELVDRHVCNSFNDFRLYGTVASTLICAPAAKFLETYVEFANLNAGFVTLGGFLAILAATLGGGADNGRETTRGARAAPTRGG